MMSAVTSTSTAVQTLARVDPEFVELVQTLYGDAVDPYVAYGEITKASPDQADTASTSSLSRRLAFAGTIAGGALGVKELAHEGPKLARAVRSGKGILIPARQTGIAATALGADALAGNELKPSKQVNKAIPPISDLTAGLRAKLGAASQRLIPATTPPGGVPKPVPNPNAKAKGQYQQLGQGVALAAGSTPGKVLIGTGVAGGALKAKQARQGTATTPDDIPLPSVGVVDPLSQQPVTKQADIEWAGTFSKFDDDKHLAFGWASVIKMNGLPVVDQQGDLIDEPELEDAAYRYVLESRKGGHMHRRTDLDEPVHVSDIVESMVFTDEKIAKMGLPDNFPRGWWIGTKIHDPEVWSEVKKGNLGGFSIHGKGKRQSLPMDSAMGW